MEKLVVKEKDKLYNYLRKNITYKSKNNIKTLLKSNSVLVNDKVVNNHDYILEVGDVISFGNSDKRNPSLKIIYEDENIIVLDKPTKLLTISNRKEKENTLYRQVSDYLRKEGKKVFIIHRLDYDTSGVIMFAKNQMIQKLYQDNWNKIAKIREYVTVVEGITESHGHIESYLKQNKSLQVYSSKGKDGLFSVTDYEKIVNNSKYSLLKIYISTGRRNQIRCHMFDIGHPIIGDSRYGSNSNPLGRLALHATLLQIMDPLTKKVFNFKSDVPKDFMGLIEK